MNCIKISLRIYLILLSIFICSKAFAQHPVDTIYASDTMIIRTFQKNGKIDMEEFYVNGKWIFFKIWYYTDDAFGSILMDKRTKKPKVEYWKEFYLDSSLWIESTKLNGKRHGAFKTYHKNGQPQCDCNYMNGKRTGIQREHYENGQMVFISNYINGKPNGIVTFYFENGNIWTERFYKDGKLWTVISNFSATGAPLEKGTLLDGNGTLYIYDEQGQLLNIERYWQGKRIRKGRVKSK